MNVTVIVGLILSISIILFSIVIDVVRFISLSIMVLPSNTCVSHYPSKGYNGIDKIIDTTTAGESMHNVPVGCKRHISYQNSQ